MAQDFHALLLAHDRTNAREWETPGGFDEHARKTLLCQVLKLKGLIEVQLGLPVHYDDGYQDASCVAHLFIQSEGGREAMIRFSSFGRLAVVFNWGKGHHIPVESPLEPELLPLVEQCAFIAIPPTVLALPYDGLPEAVHGPFNDPMLWFGRYFSYL